MKINEFEEQHLRALYSIANELDTPEAWKDVRNYYDELGEIYDFDPRRVMISTNGTVSNRSYTTIYVVMDFNDKPLQAYYDEKTAKSHADQNSNYTLHQVGLN
jgi:hypothetical protein